MTNEPYLVTTDQDKDAVTALHSMCGWSPYEQTKLQTVLDDQNCFTILGGEDEHGQPAGYLSVRIQDKEAHGLWLGVNPASRGRGLGRKLMLAGLNECRARGAETYDAYIAEDNETSSNTLSMHKKLGFLFLDTFIDTGIIREGDERITMTNHHLAVSLMTIADRKEYDGKKFSCDGGGTHPIVHFKYTPKYSHVRQLIDGELTAVCPYCDKDVIYNG